MPKVYVGNLSHRVRERDLDDLFYKFGRIRAINIKTPMRGPAFAFLDFDDDRDAEEAVHRRNGYDYDGARLRVELARGGRGGNSSRGSGPPRRSDFRVIVTGLPRSASWQDLKDHMRRAGEVGYANVFGDGSGVVEYATYDDLRIALRKLDDSEFRNPFDKSFIRVREDRGDDRRGDDRRRRRSRSRSRSPARRRRSRSPRRRSRSPSPEGGRRRSHSRSRSRSRSADRRSPSRDRDNSKPRDDDAADGADVAAVAAPAPAPESNDDANKGDGENNAADDAPATADNGGDDRVADGSDDDN